MSDPYRRPPQRSVPDVPDAGTHVLSDATLEEMIFWEKVYISCVSAADCKSSSTARAFATRAVLNRRVVFPHLQDA